MLVFLLMPTVMRLLGGEGTLVTDPSRLVGSGELDLPGYLLCVLVVLVVAALCMITSRLGVIRVLKTYD
jgi:cell division transport system permease protein